MPHVSGLAVITARELTAMPNESEIGMANHWDGMFASDVCFSQYEVCGDCKDMTKTFQCVKCVVLCDQHVKSIVNCMLKSMLECD